MIRRPRSQRFTGARTEVERQRGKFGFSRQNFQICPKVLRSSIILTWRRLRGDGRDELLGGLDRVDPHHVGHAHPLHVEPGDLPEVVRAGLQPVHREMRPGLRGHVGHEDPVGEGRLDLVDEEAEALRQPAVEAGRAVDPEAVRGLVHHGAVLHRLGLAWNVREEKNNAFAFAALGFFFWDLEE